jgi:hypothetical protein
MTCRFQFERAVKHRAGQNLRLLKQSENALAYDPFKLASELARSIVTEGSECQGAHRFEINLLSLIHRLSIWCKGTHFTVWLQEAWS